MIAALFIDGRGVYASMPGVDAWDQSRDARLYTGCLPVVAHPPCQLWGRFARVNYARWGGEHNRPGNDGGCFASALANVRRCGGVLEHPASTYAWEAHGLARPVRGTWTASGPKEWVCEVWQAAYGHLARKATWLLYCGDTEPAPMRWDRPAATHQIGRHDQRGKAKAKPTVAGRAASATPPAFAEALIELARRARP